MCPSRSRTKEEKVGKRRGRKSKRTRDGKRWRKEGDKKDGKSTVILPVSTALSSYSVSDIPSSSPQIFHIFSL